MHLKVVSQNKIAYFAGVWGVAQARTNFSHKHRNCQKGWIPEPDLWGVVLPQVLLVVVSVMEFFPSSWPSALERLHWTVACTILLPVRLSLFFCKLARLLIVPGLFSTPTPHLLHRHCILEMLYLLARGACPAEGRFGYPSHNLQWPRSPSPSNVIVADQEEKAGLLLGKGRPISDSHANVLTCTYGENETRFIFATRFF